MRILHNQNLIHVHHLFSDNNCWFKSRNPKIFSFCWKKFVYFLQDVHDCCTFASAFGLKTAVSLRFRSLEWLHEDREVVRGSRLRRPLPAVVEARRIKEKSVSPSVFRSGAAGALWARRRRSVLVKTSRRAAPVGVLARGEDTIHLYYGEFDPGSGWTLATGLTHASRGAACRWLATGDGDRRTGE